MQTKSPKSLQEKAGTIREPMGTGYRATGSGEGTPRRGAPPAGPAAESAVADYYRRREQQRGRKVPPTLPLDYDVISRHVPFRAARSVAIELWLKWRHGECERAVFTADSHVATGYCVDGEWYITLVKPR